MNSLTLTGPDAWLAFILWSVVMFYIGWAQGEGEGCRIGSQMGISHCRVFGIHE